MTTLYDKQGLPDDLLTTDIEDEREIKVSPVANEEFEVFFSKILLEQNTISLKILEQLRLLNVRFEEAFDTKIKDGDI